jgi:hypothetical protein
MRALLLTLLVVFSFLPAPARAQGDPPQPQPFDPDGWLNGGGDDDNDEPEEAKPVNDASTPEFQRAMELQLKQKWKAAQ